MRLRCPSCRTELDVLGEQSTVLVKCPSCGSQVDLSGGQATVTYVPPKLGRLGPFQLLEHVGRGHFGDVFKASDSRLQRTVAVKVPRTGDLAGSEREAFFREARTAARLRHPNIVTVHEVDTTGETIYIVSEFIDGVNLADLLDGKQLDPRRTAEICARIADALHHAHEQGVIHRDLKPRNVMLDAAGEPHLLDFGLAKQSAGEYTITSEGDILGTPAYMAPEQARGNAASADRRTDVYSLGVTLYEMLTRKRPFEGNVRGLIFQILNDEPAPPRKLRKEIPRDLETICLKAMSKRPADRYQTAGDLAADLRYYLAGEPIRARRTNPVERAWRWCRRNPAWAAASAMGALAVVSVMMAVFARDPGAPATALRPITLDVRLSLGPFQQEADPQASRVSVVFWALDREGVPGSSNPIRVQGVRPPVRTYVPPGYYLVAIEAQDGRFHEVLRHVPEEGESVNARYRHESAELTADGVVLLPAVSLPLATVHRDMSWFSGAPNFVVGSETVAESPPHSCKLPPFFLDVREVTVEDLRTALKLDELIFRHEASQADFAASEVTWDEAIAWAEYCGKRLPTEVEYEFAATNAGKQPFPWPGGEPASGDWVFGAVGSNRGDLTPGDPPVAGLYSNVAEWTATWMRPYPAHKAMGMIPPLEPRDWRIVRGAPAKVLMDNVSGTHLGSGPRYRHMMLRSERSAKVGFRCARSVRPRMNGVDLECIVSVP